MQPSAKPSLPMTSVPVFRVYHTDLEAYVRRVYGFDYDFMFALCITGEVGVEVQVDGELPSLAWKRRADELRGGKRDKDVRLILNTLCADGFIPRGAYTITTKTPPINSSVYRELLLKTGDPNSPECLAMKRMHAGDQVFTERAAILDRSLVEQQAA